MKNYKIKSYKSNVFFVFILITLIFIQCKDDDDNGNVIELISCDDGIQNGDEDGIDCGGSLCLPCQDNQLNFDGNFVQEDIDLINKPLTPIQERYNFTETHIVYDNNEILTSRETWSKVQWVLTRINSKSLIRMKVNSYPRTEELVHHKDHFDLPYAHKGGILYFNANDGVTVLEDGTEVESVPNRILLFDSSKPHHSTTTTNANRRVNLNFNYF